MGRKNKNTIDQSVFNHMGREGLLECSKILGVETTQLIKGGVRSEVSNNQLRSSIRRCLSQGTFPSRIERLTEFLDEWEPTQLDELDLEGIKPEEKARELIENIRNNFNRLPDLKKLEILTNWVQNPQGSCCYEELDVVAEQLGFTYEEIGEEYVLVLPSPQVVTKIINSMSNADFYHSVIALAGMSLLAEEYPQPPSICNAGYDFLGELTQYFSFYC